MKKIITLAAFMVTVFTTSSFANDSTYGVKTASNTVKTAFSKDFRNAEMISSEVRKDFTIVNFKMDDLVLSAFYSDNGDLLAVSRNILSTQLPIALQINLKNNYSSYWVTECIEMNGSEQSNYYITLENADRKITLKSRGDSSWEVYQKADKK